MQTVETWEPAGAFGDLTAEAINVALDILDRSLPDGSRYVAKKSTADTKRWAVPLLMEHLDRTEDQAKGILAAWLCTAPWKVQRDGEAHHHGRAGAGARGWRSCGGANHHAVL